jgi:hypothetical protein
MASNGILLACGMPALHPVHIKNNSFTSDALSYNKTEQGPARQKYPRDCRDFLKPFGNRHTLSKKCMPAPVSNLTLYVT